MFIFHILLPKLHNQSSYKPAHLKTTEAAVGTSLNIVSPWFLLKSCFYLFRCFFSFTTFRLSHVFRTKTNKWLISRESMTRLLSRLYKSFYNYFYFPFTNLIKFSSFVWIYCLYIEKNHQQKN